MSNGAYPGTTGPEHGELEINPAMFNAFMSLGTHPITLSAATEVDTVELGRFMVTGWRSEGGNSGRERCYVRLVPVP